MVAQRSINRASNVAPTPETSAPVTNVSPGRSGTQRKSFMELKRTTRTANVTDKMQIVGTVKQRLAEAFDLYRAAGDNSREATAIADQCGVSLYQGVASGVISLKELSPMIGDISGYKMKGGTADSPPVPAADPNASKTPWKHGEALRKRVMRAVQADQYVNNIDVTPFFDGLPETEVNDILQSVKQGSMSLFTAYDKLTELKRDNQSRVDAAFDPKKIAGLFDMLSQNGGKTAARALVNVPGLVEAYEALIEAFSVADELAAEIAESAEEAEAEEEAEAA